ncbi:MAG: B12-binding domain-containing radical SAM protein [Gammaproteobacteria bacterium]|nr:B12-binding domain-containing radical SAM protein [Gammaproteobacteria bacterium]
MPTIVLTTLNARYIHASLGLRYLAANMGELESDTEIMEFTLQNRAEEIVEALLAAQPRIIGFGVYIWNVNEITRVVALLKCVAPQITVVLGGPEVSYECDEQEVVRLADHVITGWGDISFAKLCRELLQQRPQAQKIIAGIQPKLAEIKLPYAYYSDSDIAHRTLYVEASRGCPFKCEFCLSALDKTAWAFDLDRILDELDNLYSRGARQFKFVDRTFNLNIKDSVRILEFFLECLDEKLFVHFEVIPDHLPEQLKALIVKFPAGALQFEVGIQTLNPAVQALISRKQDTAKAEENLRWLRQESQAHIHVDLIIGLPGEDVASIADGFDRLIALKQQEIQVGVLKRLRGTPITRHTGTYAMRYTPYPPYAILSNDRIDFPTMQRLVRFARYWNLVGNSGRFAKTLPLLLDESPFARFLTFSDWLYATTRKTHQIPLPQLFDLLFTGLTTVLAVAPETARATLEQDFLQSGSKEMPLFLRNEKDNPRQNRAGNPAKRQARLQAE